MTSHGDKHDQEHAELRKVYDRMKGSNGIYNQGGPGVITLASGVGTVEVFMQHDERDLQELVLPLRISIHLPFPQPYRQP